MAKQTTGYMGGFSGKLGPAVGYMWRGVWCVRSHNPAPRNPRTKAQTAHREMFKREVQLAAAMRWAVNLGFRDLAYDMHMTPYNLFVHLNQGAFGLEDGVFTVDCGRLCLCTGPRAGVAFGAPEWTADNVLSVGFGKDASGRPAAAYDKVYLYVWCPDLERGFLAAPVYRRTKRVSVALPDDYVGREVHLYGMVCSEDGQWSETVYAGSLTLVERAYENDEPEATDGGSSSVALCPSSGDGFAGQAGGGPTAPLDVSSGIT